MHEMRRKRQMLPEAETLAILEQGTSGTLALIDDEGLPYAVPLSYVYEDGSIFFHSAREGHKVAALHCHPVASFCVIGQDVVVPEEYSTLYRSAVAFGRLHVIEDPTEVDRAIRALGHKYRPGCDDALSAEIEKDGPGMLMFALDVERLTGKESRRLMQQRKG